MFCTVSGQFEWHVFPLPNFEKQRVKEPSHYNHLYVPAKRHVLLPTGFISVAKFAVPLPVSARSPWTATIKTGEFQRRNFIVVVT